MAKDFTLLYKLGETIEEVHIDSAQENKNATLSLAKQARHSIDIFTQNMDAEIYNNKEFEQCIFNLAKRHPTTKIRILAQDTRSAVQNGHRLIKLSQSITSSVFINKPSPEYKDEQCAFLVADKLGLLYRATPNHRNYSAEINFMSPQHAAKLTDFFNEVWQHSTPDIQTRNIYM